MGTLIELWDVREGRILPVSTYEQLLRKNRSPKPAKKKAWWMRVLFPFVTLSLLVGCKPANLDSGVVTDSEKITCYLPDGKTIHYTGRLVPFDGYAYVKGDGRLLATIYMIPCYSE